MIKFDMDFYLINKHDGLIRIGHQDFYLLYITYMINTNRSRLTETG